MWCTSCSRTMIPPRPNQSTRLGSLVRLRSGSRDPNHPCRTAGLADAFSAPAQCRRRHSRRQTAISAIRDGWTPCVLLGRPQSQRSGVFAASLITDLSSSEEAAEDAIGRTGQERWPVPLNQVAICIPPTCLRRRKLARESAPLRPAAFLSSMSSCARTTLGVAPGAQLGTAAI
jgi:hypothetical protein